MNVQEETKFEQEFPIAAVRQKKIMDKMTRCHFCGRLCCCIKHLLEHENQHLTQDTENAVARAEHIGFEQPRGWVDATESILVTCAKKINFPLFCVYCKICIREKHNLQYLINRGPQCPLKDSHWLVSLTKYNEIAGCSDLGPEIKENLVSTSLFVENKLGPLRQTNCTKYKPTHRSFQLFCHRNSSKMAYSSFSNISSSPLNASSQGEVSACTPKDISNIVERMQPFSTSTPQDTFTSSALDIDISIPLTAQTPVCAKNVYVPQSILSGVRNDQKQKGNSSRKVTFSSHVETTESQSTDDQFLTTDREENVLKDENGNGDNSITEKCELKNEENENDIAAVLEQIHKQSQNANSKLSVWENIIDKQNKIKIENLEEIQQKRQQNKLNECDISCEKISNETSDISLIKNQSEKNSKNKENELGQEDKLQTTAEIQIEDSEGDEEIKMEGEEKNSFGSSMKRKEGLKIPKNMDTEDNKNSKKDDLEYYSKEDTEKECNKFRNSRVHTTQLKENELESLVSSTVESPSRSLSHINNETQTISISKNISFKEEEISHKEDKPHVPKTRKALENKPVSSIALRVSSETSEAEKLNFKVLQTPSKPSQNKQVRSEELHSSNNNKKNESINSELLDKLGETSKKEIIIIIEEFPTSSNSLNNKSRITEDLETSNETTKADLISSKLVQSSNETLKKKTNFTEVSQIFNDSSFNKSIISEALKTSTTSTENKQINTELLLTSSETLKKKPTTIQEHHSSNDSSINNLKTSDASDTKNEIMENDSICSELYHSFCETSKNKTEIMEVIQPSRDASDESRFSEVSDISSAKNDSLCSEPFQLSSEILKREGGLTQVLQIPNKPSVSEPKSPKLLQISNEISKKKTRDSDVSFTSSATSKKNSPYSKVLCTSNATTGHKLIKSSNDFHTENVEPYFDGPCTSHICKNEHGKSMQVFKCPDKTVVDEESNINDKNDDDDDDDQEWSFTKFTSALSTSWNRAKNLVMQSFRKKRDNSDSSEEDSDEIHTKRIKLSRSCSSNDMSLCMLPVKRKCKQKPIRTYDYNIKSRRPLPRMEKRGSQ